MKFKCEGRDRPAPGRAALALGIALGAALVLGAPQAALAQRGGDQEHRPNSPTNQNQKSGPQNPPQDQQNKDRDHKGGDFNKWDKGWKGQDGHKRPQAKPEQPGRGGHKQPQAKPQQPGRGQDGGGGFKPFNSGIDRNRVHDMARSHNMTGYNPLPDSVRRNMHVGHPLPPKANPQPVPDYMRKRLPHHPDYEWRITGRDLVLVAVGSLIVYEIFDNVFN